jgi:hypothetical protein
MKKKEDLKYLFAYFCSFLFAILGTQIAYYFDYKYLKFYNFNKWDAVGNIGIMGVCIMALHIALNTLIYKLRETHND